MLKHLALVLVLAAGCKSDAPASKPAAGDQGGTAAAPVAPGVAKPRSSKIDLGPRNPRDPSGPRLSEEDTERGDEAAMRERWEARRKERIARFDTDGDGQISDEERAAARKQRQEEMLARMDRDGDGKVSEEERAAVRHERATSMFERLDTDGDGKLSPEEMSGGRFNRLEGADTNGDGTISVDELDAAMATRFQRGGGGPRGGGPRGEGGTPPAE